MVKGEFAYDEQYLLFPQFLLKTCTADTSKPGLVWEIVKTGIIKHRSNTNTNTKQ